MDQRDSIPSPRSKSRACQPRAKNNPKQHRDPHHTASLPTTATASSLQTSANLNDEDVSISEPSLRFPRPQGNKRLANWISSSDPNIMDLASENGSEPGLAGSTYELINKEGSSPNAQHLNTDSESQDDSQHDFDESVSESIGSLDQFRQDDVQSLASTDHIEDEEDDGFQHHYDDDHDDHDDVSTAPDDEGSRLTDVTMVNQEEAPAIYSAEDDQEHSDAESRSSIEYTRQSLGTPSILTPEGSKILSPALDDVVEAMEQTRASSKGDRTLEAMRTTSKAVMSRLSDSVTSLVPPQPAQGDKKAWNRYRQEHWFATEVWHAVDVVRQNPRQIAISILTIILASIMLGHSDRLRSQSVPKLDFITVETSTTTTTVIVESTILVPPAETKQAMHTSTGVALIPIHESHGDEGLFGYSMPSVSFAPEGESGVFIHVKPSVPKTWTAQRECVKIHATRGEKTIPLNVNFTSSDAIHVEFGMAEAYGIVQIKLSSKCRPKFEKSVKVHFGKGVIEQMFDCVGELAHVFTGLQFPTAPKAERCQALKSISSNVDRTLTSAKEKGVKLVSSQVEAASRILGPLGDDVMKISQEAARRLHQAEGTLTTVSGYTSKPLSQLKTHGTRFAESSLLHAGKVLGKVRDNVASSTKSAFEKAALSQRVHQAHLKKAVSDIRLDELQDQIQFGILDAQVAAKTWWLKMTGREDQSKEYGRRAKEFVAELRSFSARDTATAKRGMARADKSQRKNQCKSKRAGKGREPHRCVPAA